MRRKGLVAAGIVMALMLSGCGDKVDNKDDKAGDNQTSVEGNVSVEEAGNIAEEGASETVGQSVSPSASTSDLFSDRDYDFTYNESESAVITLSGSGASCSSDAVNIDGSTITIKDEGTYILRGELKDGVIIVDAGEDDKTQLVLESANINSAEGAPIYVAEADKVFVTLAEGTDNTLSNGGTFTPIAEEEIDGVIYSKCDLTLQGNGALNIESPAGHGVVGKDELTIVGGNYNITSASSGFNANDNISIDGATVKISSGKDGIHCEHNEDTSLGFIYVENGSFDITSQGDGISASGYMKLQGGTYNINAGGGYQYGESQSSDSWGDMPGGGGGGMMPGGGGGGMMPGGGRRSIATVDVINNTSQTLTTDESTSMKGIKASGDLYINGGTFDIDSADDGVHSDAGIIMTQGNLVIATGDDAFHAEANLDISGGVIDVTTSYEGLEGLDIMISGGDISLVAADDGINAAGGTDSSGYGGRDDELEGFGGGPGQMGGMGATGGSIVISGGTIDIQASGDGIDSNGTLEITGGATAVCGPTQGDTAVLDYEATGTIEGGSFIGTGAYMMAQSLESDTQGVLPISVGQQSAGSEIVIADSQGNVIIRHTPKLEYQIFIASTPDIVKGQTYTITIGEISGEVQAE